MEAISEQDVFARVPYQRTTVEEFDYGWASRWTLVEADDNAAIAAVSIYGELHIDLDGDDNEQGTYVRNQELYLFAAGHQWEVEQCIKHAYSADATINWCNGVASTFAADCIVDNGTGFAASATGAFFIAFDGDTNLSVQVHRNGIAQTLELTAANTITKKTYLKQDAAYRRFKVKWTCPPHLTTGLVEFFIDKDKVAEFDVVAYTERMAPGGAVKLGSDVAVDHYVNWVRENQKRVLA